MNKVYCVLMSILFIGGIHVNALAQSDYKKAKDVLAAVIHLKLEKSETEEMKKGMNLDGLRWLRRSVSDSVAETILNQPGIVFPLNNSQISDLAELGVSKSITWEKIDGASEPVYISTQIVADKRSENYTQYYFWVKVDGSNKYIFSTYSDCKTPPATGWDVEYSKNKGESAWTLSHGEPGMVKYGTDTIVGQAAKLACAKKTKAIYRSLSDGKK